MINIKELKLELANNFGLTGQIKIEFKNGKTDFVGYVHKMNDETLDFTMMWMNAPIGESSYFNLNFDNIKKIVIKYQGSNDTRTFE